jgi:GntR family histidine utilization transcriptional repressor
MSGEWPPGTRVPAERELMADYGCSRMTVSKVLSAMAACGLVTRRRGAGSEVAMPLAGRAVLEIRDFAKEAAESGTEYAHEVLRREIVSADIRTAARLGLPKGAKLVVIDTLHRIAGLPEAYEQRLISVAAVLEARTETFLDLPPGTWLLEHVPWTSAEHAIEAVNADERQAALLELKPGTACLLLERRTWQAGKLITEARITYPGARHRFIGRFSPAAQG